MLVETLGSPTQYRRNKYIIFFANESALIEPKRESVVYAEKSIQRKCNVKERYGNKGSLSFDFKNQ